MLELVVVATAVYLALSPRVLMPFYNTMIFHPSRYPLGSYDKNQICGIKAEDVFFRSKNGKLLHGWYFALPGSQKTVLISHGNAGNVTSRLDLCALFLELGNSVFIYDYQGYGRSEGTPSLKGIREDADAAYDYLISVKKIQPESIVLLGESLGSGAACHLAAIEPCAGLILQSPLSSLKRIAKEILPYLRLYPEWLLTFDDLDNLSVVKTYAPPVLIIHGDQDTVVPVKHSEELYEHCQLPREFVRFPNSNHGDIYIANASEYKQAAMRFLESLPKVGKKEQAAG